MSLVESAILFWDIVEATLVEIYGFQPADAKARIARLHGKLTPRAINRDLTYHWQPLNIALDIAHATAPIPEAQLAAYYEIVQRLLAPLAQRVTLDPATSSKKGIVRAVEETEAPVLAAR